VIPYATSYKAANSNFCSTTHRLATIRYRQTQHCSISATVSFLILIVVLLTPFGPGILFFLLLL